MNNRHPWPLKKSKSWGPFWSYQLNSTANLAHLAHFLGKWAGLAVLFSWYLQNGPQDFVFFNCQGCQTFLLAEIHCYLSALKSWHNNLFLSGVNDYFFLLNILGVERSYKCDLQTRTLQWMFQHQPKGWNEANGTSTAPSTTFTHLLKVKYKISKLDSILVISLLIIKGI